MLMTNENRKAVIYLYLYSEDFLLLFQVTSSPLPADKKLFREKIKDMARNSFCASVRKSWKTISRWEKVIKKGVFTYVFLSTVLCDAWTMATQQKLRSWEVHVCRGWILSLVLTPTDNLPFHLYVGLLAFPSLWSAQIFSGFNEFHWSSFVGMIRFLLINYVCSQHVHILLWAATLCVCLLFVFFCLFFSQQNQNWP